MRSSNAPRTASTSARVTDDDSTPPAIFAVQHFCLHDGPGTRSVVFYKGCPMRCTWCQNPESWCAQIELGHKSHLCVACRSCVQACPTGAMLEPGRWNAEACDLCGRCVEACPTRALVRFGERLTPEQLLEQLRPEFDLHRSSGGGVTFSGGEVTLFANHAALLASALRQAGIHVAIETCGLYQPSAAARLLAVTDLVLFDLKVFSEADHRRLCGGNNARIKANLESLVAEADEGRGPPVWTRLPLVPGLTATPENLERWAALLVGLDIDAITLLPYHSMGAGKRGWLQGTAAGPAIERLDDRDLTVARATFELHGIRCFAPGEEPWHELPARRAS